jgi:hypothetical protein
MVKDTQWPYHYCPDCGKLSPVQYMGKAKFCLKCAYTFDKLEGGRVVFLSPNEARLRKLSVVKDESTGELE